MPLKDFANCPYTGIQSVLNNTLGEEYQAKGFRLLCIDDLAVLCFRDNKIGSFSRASATKSNIQDTCREYLAAMKY